MGKPWMEDWPVVKMTWGDLDPSDPFISWVVGKHDLETCAAAKDAPADIHEGHEAVARLASQAPAMARTLCRLEWSLTLLVTPPTGVPGLVYACMPREVQACPACRAQRPGPESHAPSCWLDALLTAAGLTPADREEARCSADT